MRADEYTRIERLDTVPAGQIVSNEEKEQALRDALRGVDLGSYDELVVGWLSRHLDGAKSRTLVSLVARARRAGVADTLTVAEAGLSGVAHDLDGGAQATAGNSGPGF